MGTGHSARRDSFDANGEVNFDHFQILRAIGKGSFGKVCIVQKKDTKKMFAMKYMNKQMCVKKDAVTNVMREVDILKTLDHPFLVNLWFTFQDEEDMFVVVDLLLGGDLRYHMQQDVAYSEDQVKLYICEIGLALDYLQRNHILHRDIKPDNILLDEGGHVHITDFNIATVLNTGELATSMSGTKPYMAPEVFACALNECLGYSYPVDWWSLGITAYELLKGRRPFDIHSSTLLQEVQILFNTTKPHFSTSLSENCRYLLKQRRHQQIQRWGQQREYCLMAPVTVTSSSTELQLLLELDPDSRISTLAQLKHHPFMQSLDFNQVLNKEIKPAFVPSKEHLNCDPTYELEEMIIETKPLHKKKKRLAKQNSRRAGELLSQSSTEMDEIQKHLVKLNDDFVAYNRERNEEMENKEVHGT